MAKKKTAKKAAKKTASKSTKKAVKKAAEKTARKVKKTAKRVAKTVKKAVKKVAKKAKASTKRSAKKSAKAVVSKTAGKAVRRPAAPKSPRRPARPRPSEPAAAGFPPVGQIAPDFELMDNQGRAHRLSDYQGRRVVLYFYPKDDTPGCTKEACGFRDVHSELQQRDVVVLGVSPDTVDSHQRFVSKYGLNFPLLADRDHAVAEQYGAWGEKNMYGRVSFGIKRSTFVIDAGGRIEKVFANVKADGHEQQVLAYLDQ